MNSEEKEKPASIKRLILKIIGSLTLIIGIILLISGITFLVRADSMFGDPEAPWWETVSTGNGLLAGGFFMIFPSIFVLVAARQYQYMSKTISAGGVKTLGHTEEFERYEKMIKEGSKPRTTGTSRQQEMTSYESSNGSQVVKIRCQLCGALNDEDAKFCDQCAQPL